MRNTSQIGEVTVAQVIAALAKVGKLVLLPFGGDKRYDLVIEEEDGRFLRIQCKTGRLIRGAVTFYPCSVDSRSEKGRCIRKSYGGQVELFGIYCPDNDKVYLVPIGALTDQQQCRLRVEPPRNNQQSGIRWGKDYEVETPARLGDNADLAFSRHSDTIKDD